MQLVKQPQQSATVIGLGDMGTALATAFLQKGLSTTVWNRSPQKAEPLVAQGAVKAATVAEALQANQLIVVCLLNYDTVYEVLDPAGDSLSGRLLVNLTNGTPEQARAMAQWAGDRGAAYIDGGIMAIPPMIGKRETLIVYSGSKEAFNIYQPVLEVLGACHFVGEDAGLAPLHDISLLMGMYGMLSGALQAFALITSEKITAQQFLPLLINWVNAMMGEVHNMAEQVDKDDYFTNVVSNLKMQAVAYENFISACRSQGLNTDLIQPLQQLMNRAIAAGYGGAHLSAVVKVIRKL